MRTPFFGFVVVLAATLAGCRAWISPPATEVPSELPSDCPHTPLGGFYDVWRKEEIGSRLGCAIEPAEPITGTEASLCCDLRSIWVQEELRFVTLDMSASRWAFVPDDSGIPASAIFVTPTWAPTPGSPKPTPPTAAPTPTSATPPVATGAPSPTLEQATVTPLAAPLTPLPTVVLMTRLTWSLTEPCFPASGRHAWVANLPRWAEECRGLSATNETLFHGAMERFEGGWLLWDGNMCYVLHADGTWRWP